MSEPGRGCGRRALAYSCNLCWQSLLQLYANTCPVALQAKAAKLQLPFNLSFAIGGSGYSPAAIAPFATALAAGASF